MFQLFLSARLRGDRSRGSSRAVSRALVTRLLLFLFVALAPNSLAPAKSRNPRGSLLGKTQASQAAPAPAATPPAESKTPTAIPLPDVSARAEELARLLRTIGDQLPT